jgi:hypothetical protein
VIATMLLEPRVEGEEIASRRIGKIAVAHTERLTIVSVDYCLPWQPAVSDLATLTSFADRMASSDNRLEIPARSVIDWARGIGGRSAWRPQPCVSASATYSTSSAGGRTRPKFS